MQCDVAIQNFKFGGSHKLRLTVKAWFTADKLRAANRDVLFIKIECTLIADCAESCLKA